CEREARAPRAHHHRDLVAHDQLLGDRGSFGRVALVVLDHELQFLAQHPALGIDFVGGDLRAVGDVVSGRRERTGQRLNDADLDALLRGCRCHAGSKDDCRERRLAQVLPHVCPSIVRAAPADPRVATRSVRGVAHRMRSALSLLARVLPRPGRQWLSCRDDNMRSERPGKPKLTPRYAANCMLSRQPRAAPWAWFFAPSSWCRATLLTSP